MEIALFENPDASEIMDLLLAADPNRAAVAAYIRDADIIVALLDGEIIGVSVLVNYNDGFEIKNISVAEKFQGRGVGKRLIEESLCRARESGGKFVEVGTGNSSLDQLAFYQKRGFRLHRVERDFFKSYPEPIFENGIRCLDMVRLRFDL